MLRSKCEELDRLKELLAATEETLRKTTEDLVERSKECDRLGEKLGEEKAFVEKLTKGKR